MILLIACICVSCIPPPPPSQPNTSSYSHMRSYVVLTRQRHGLFTQCLLSLYKSPFFLLVVLSSSPCLWKWGEGNGIHIAVHISLAGTREINLRDRRRLQRNLFPASGNPNRLKREILRGMSIPVCVYVFMCRASTKFMQNGESISLVFQPFD